MGLLRGAADGQRAAWHASRPVADLQGHLPALQDDVRVLRRAQGRLGLSWPAGGAGGGEGARDDLQGGHREVRDRRVQRPLPRDGAEPRRGLEPDGRADRPLDRPRARLQDARPRLHRVGVVGAEDDPRQGAAVREAEGGPVLHALRHGAFEPRARAARRLPGRHRPLRIRPLSGDRRTWTHPPRRRAADLDHHPVDARLERGGRDRPGAALRTGRARRTHRDPRGGARRREFWARTPRSQSAPSAEASSSAPATSRRSTSSRARSTDRRDTPSCPATSSPTTMAPASFTPRSRSARTTSGSARSRG